MPVVTIGGRAGLTYTGVEDTTLNEAAATTNYGSSDTLNAQSFDTRQHALIKFTGLSNITGPVTVDSVTLYIYSEGGYDQYTISVRRVLQNWVEGQATWNIYSTGNNWNTAGGLGAASDRVSATSATFTHTNASGDKTASSAGMASDVEGWINGTLDNYGWMLSNDASADGNYSTLGSDERATATERPYLSVDYTESGASAPKRSLLLGIG